MDQNSKEIRRKAEKKFKEKGEKQDSFSDDKDKLIEELNIHQIELEMQNDQLQEAQRKIIEEQEKYKDLFMNAPVGYFILNKTGNILELNKAAASMLGISTEASIYTSIFPYLTEGSKISFTRFFNKVYESDKDEFDEIAFIDKNENITYGSLIAETYYDKNHNERLVRCTVVDKTKTKYYENELRLQQELNESETRWSSLFDNSGVAMLLIDPTKGNIEDANKAASDYYGYSISELKQMKISEINEMSDEDIQKEIDQTRRLGKKHFNFKHRRFNNDVRDVEVYSTAIQLKDQTRLFSIIHDITERKLAEEKIEKINNQLEGALEEVKTANENLNSTNERMNDAISKFEKERTQFLSILNNIPEIIYVADIETHEILFANQKLKEMAGREVVGEKCYSVIQNALGVCEFCTTDKIKQTDKPYFWYHFNKNLHKHFYIMDRKIDWTDGRRVRFTMDIDVTSQKEAEQKLQEEEWLLNQMGEIAEIGGWKIDLKTQELSWTKEVFEIHELGSNKQPTVEEAVAFYDKESLPVIQKALEKTIGQGKPFDLELSIITAKGNKKIVRAKGRLQKDEYSNSVIGVFQDITSSKEKELALNELNQRYKQLFEFMPVGISIADKDGQLVENNKEAERLLGMSQEKHNERTIDASEWRIIKTDGSVMTPDEFASVKALKENRLVENVEMGIWKGEDQTTWINVSAVPIVSKDGLIISYIDISEKIEREAKLREANATKDKFFNIIAHDLKNPFTSIIGFTKLLRNNLESYDKEKIRDFIERIENSSSATFKLLENLLEWSRMQTGKVSFFPDRIIAEQLVINVIEQVSSMALAKNITIDYSIDKGIMVNADENMLVAILRNLLSNAIKFSYEGGAIEVKVIQDEHFVWFEVKDNGTGMEKNTIEKLFKVSEKVSVPGTNQEMGTGLGLILCKEFVEQHKGKILVHSEPGKGSSFRFSVPKD